MANTSSAKKAIRSSQRKRAHNLYWRKMIRVAEKDLDENIGSKQSETDILNVKLQKLQKVVDKAAKVKVIHKNKANRIKSKYAKRITALGKTKKSASNKATK